MWEIWEKYIDVAKKHNERIPLDQVKDLDWAIFTNRIDGSPWKKNDIQPSLESIRKQSIFQMWLLERYIPNISSGDEKLILPLAEKLKQSDHQGIISGILDFMRTDLGLRYNYINALNQWDIKKGVNLENDSYELDWLDQKILLEQMQFTIKDYDGGIKMGVIDAKKKETYLKHKDKIWEFITLLKSKNTLGIKKWLIGNRKCLDEVNPQWTQFHLTEREKETAKGIDLNEILRKVKEGYLFTGVCRDFSVIFYHLFNFVATKNNLDMHAILVTQYDQELQIGHMINRILDKNGDVVASIDISHLVQSGEQYSPDTEPPETQELWIAQKNSEKMLTA